MSELKGLVNKGIDGWSATFDRDFARPPDDLWSACTDPARLARWFCPVEGELRPGREVHALFDDGRATFLVDECDEPRSLVLRWRHATYDSVVRATISGTDSGSRLELVHEGLTENSVAGYTAGWHWYLDRLGRMHGTTPIEESEWDDLASAYAEDQKRAGSR